LQRGTDLPRMHNFDRLPLVYAASCDIGFFDDPRREGMAEDFLAMPSGGGIGVISATRLVYSADNAQFNRVVYDKLFSGEDLSICEALFAAKLQRQYSSPYDTIPSRVDNDRAYTFFGGPYMKLDSLQALGVTNLAGRITDGGGSLYPYDGTLHLTVYDSDRLKTYRIASDTTSIVYDVAGPSLYRGSVGISGGLFDMQFMVPLDITYRGTSARVSAYAVFDDADGVGLVDSIPVGDEVAQITDSTGPQIVYSIVGRESFVSGDVVAQDGELAIQFSDSSGINLVGGIGHGITLTVDNRADQAINLTDRFEYNRDDYMSGQLTWALSELSPGQHHLKIKAWDNANNVATAEFDIEIALEGRLAINELLNYPNPMGESTTFYFELTQAVDQLSIEIFTLSGKKIWKTSRFGLDADYYPNSSLSIVWDGRDIDGDRVGTGVYIYKTTAVPRTSGETIEEFGKIVVVN
jgi:hypothetical protein